MDFEQAEALGVSRPAFDEVLDILGHAPSIDELSTLLAMWESNGRQQSLYAWLRGQHHATRRDEYLYAGPSDDHRQISEPRIRECLDIALKLAADAGPDKADGAIGKDRGAKGQGGGGRSPLGDEGGMLLYMVGNVSGEFLGSDYARRCLHLAAEPVATAGVDEDRAYIAMIVEALEGSGLLVALGEVGGGGLFGSLLRGTAPRGFDILAPREVRLDAFLFGEERGRFLIATTEVHDDAFLLKMDEARLNCCFLGRSTKGRVVVDGYDFGPVDLFLHNLPTP